MERRESDKKIHLPTISTIIVVVSAIIGYGIWIGQIQSKITATEALANESKQNIVQLQGQNTDIKVQLMKLETQLIGIQVTLEDIKEAVK